MVTDASEAEATGHHPNQIGTGCIAHVTVLRQDRTANSTPLCAVTALANATRAQESKQVVVDETLVNEIREAYGKDPWCKQLLSAMHGMPELHIKDGLWFIGERLIVPAGCDAQERIFRLAHDDKGRIGLYTKLCDFTLLFIILQVELRLNKDH